MGMLKKEFRTTAGILLTVFCAYASETWALQAPADEEKALAPWIDLQSGGHAVGPAQTSQKKNSDGTSSPRYGSLQNRSLLPSSGEGFVRLNSPETSWGTGMIISLIENSTAFFVKNFPVEHKVHIGSIAQQNGGAYGPHKSHQNGLDGDVLYMGRC